MGLQDFSYVAGLGSMCATTWQIMRATALQGMDPCRSFGPFDWFQLDSDQVVKLITSDFDGFFNPESVRLDGLSGHTWKVTSDSGISSWHHLPVRPPEAAPGAWSWYQFGLWLGERIAVWKAMVNDPAANILFVRAEDPLNPDDDAAVERLVHALSSVVVGRFRLAAISYERSAPAERHSPDSMSDPRLVRFVLDLPLPKSLPIEEVDWSRNYGQGIAWRGSTASWQKVWNAV